MYSLTCPARFGKGQNWTLADQFRAGEPSLCPAYPRDRSRFHVAQPLGYGPKKKKKETATPSTRSIPKSGPVYTVPFPRLDSKIRPLDRFSQTTRKKKKKCSSFTSARKRKNPNPNPNFSLSFSISARQWTRKTSWVSPKPLFLLLWTRDLAPTRTPRENQMASPERHFPSFPSHLNLSVYFSDFHVIDCFFFRSCDMGFSCFLGLRAHRRFGAYHAGARRLSFEKTTSIRQRKGMISSPKGKKCDFLVQFGFSPLGVVKVLIFFLV